MNARSSLLVATVALTSGCLQLHGEKIACRDQDDCLPGFMCQDELCVGPDEASDEDAGTTGSGTNASSGSADASVCDGPECEDWELPMPCGLAPGEECAGDRDASSRIEVAVGGDVPGDAAVSDGPGTTADAGTGTGCSPACPEGLDCVGGSCQADAAAPWSETCESEAVIRVDVDSTSSEPDGTSWERAFYDLEDGLAAALTRHQECDTPVGVWVAEGTYATGFLWWLSDQVSWYGGFRGHETHRDERDPSAATTVLSGDVDGDDAGGGLSDNAEQLVRCVDSEAAMLGVPGTPPTAATVVDGFTLRAALQNSVDCSAAAPTLRHLIVEQHGGAAIRVASPALLENLTVLKTNAHWAEYDPAVEVLGTDGEGTAVLRNVAIFGERNGLQVDSADVELDHVYVSRDVRLLGGRVTANDCVFEGTLDFGLGSGGVLERLRLAGRYRVVLGEGSLVTMRSAVFAGRPVSDGRRFIAAVSQWADLRLKHATIAGATLDPADDAFDVFLHGIVDLGNSVVYGNQFGSLGDVRVGAGCVPGGVPLAECDTGPMFRGFPAATGTWTSVSYDPERIETTFVDSSARFAPNALAGLWIEPETTTGGWWPIVANTAHSITVRGDQTVAAGSAYALHDIRLHEDSKAIDGAWDQEAPELDIVGQGRVDLPDRNRDRGVADLGAHELTEAVRDSCQVDCD